MRRLSSSLLAIIHLLGLGADRHGMIAPLPPHQIGPGRRSVFSRRARSGQNFAGYQGPRERERRRLQMEKRAERAAAELRLYLGKPWSENYGDLPHWRQIDKARRIERLEREVAWRDAA